MRSGRQTARRLIIFRRTCTPAILFWAYSYAGPSNFGRFGQMFWRIIDARTPINGSAAQCNQLLVLCEFENFAATSDAIKRFFNEF